MCVCMSLTVVKVELVKRRALTSSSNISHFWARYSQYLYTTYLNQFNKYSYALTKYFSNQFFISDYGILDDCPSSDVINMDVNLAD